MWANAGLKTTQHHYPHSELQGHWFPIPLRLRTPLQCPENLTKFHKIIPAHLLSLVWLQKHTNNSVNSLNECGFFSLYQQYLCMSDKINHARRSSQSILKEINPEYSLEGLMMKLKLQHFVHLIWRAHWKRPWCWEKLRARGKGDNKDETVGWYHWFNGHEFKQTPGDSEGSDQIRSVA